MQGVAGQADKKHNNSVFVSKNDPKCTKETKKRKKSVFLASTLRRDKQGGGQRDGVKMGK